jgi:hypothetical protein
MDSLLNAFHDREAEIRVRRAQDPLFDEVCRDFELLSSELASNAFAAGTDAAPWRADAEDSLRALKAEIIQLLGGKPPDPAKP